MNKLSGEGGRNPLKTSSSAGVSGSTKSQTRPAKIPFPSKVTKSKSVQKKKRIAKVERDSESSVETEEMFGWDNNADGAEMM